MDRLKAIKTIRKKLKSGEYTIGSWMQIANSSIAEIMGQSEFDWVAVDLEHGSMSIHQLPNLFRALELGNTLPLARVALGAPKDCKLALDAGAGGVIIPMVETSSQLNNIKNYCCWPPTGSRGIAFSRANMYGKNFDEYKKESQAPLLIAMIETYKGLENINEILSVDGLDAILVGPYDLSASLGITAQFLDKKFIKALDKISHSAKVRNIPLGIHVVEPSPSQLNERIKEGYQFLAYSIDSVILRHFAKYKNIKY
jgi:2-dehydro-3-deoxyglucarate aldolase